MMDYQTVAQGACEKIEEAVSRFLVNGEPQECRRYGNGHINDTFLLTYETPSGGEKHYILQRMNHSIFKNPQQLMENMVHVTEYLRKIIAANGGDPDRETLNPVRTAERRMLLRG